MAFGIPGIFNTTYVDVAPRFSVSKPYKGLPTEKDIDSYKIGAVILVGLLGMFIVLTYE